MLPELSSALSPSGWLGPLMLSLVRLLAHCCHSHLVARNHMCKAMLITIVMRVLFLAGSVSPAVWQSGAVSSLGSTKQGWLWWLLKDMLVFPSFSPLCHHPHLACDLLASLLASFHHLLLVSSAVPTEDTWTSARGTQVLQ